MTVTAPLAPSKGLPIAILALAAINFAVGTQGFVFGGVLAELAADLGVSIGRAGLLVAASAVVIAMMSPVAVVLVAAYDKKTVILIALVLLAGINIASAFAPDYNGLMVLRVLAGLATAFGGSLVSAAVPALVQPEQRGKAFALVVGGITVAFILGIPVGSVIGGLYGWRATFLFGAFVVGIAIALTLTLLPRVAPAAPPPLDLRAITGNPVVTRLIALVFLGFMATFTLVSFIGPFVTHTTGATGAGVGFYQLFVGFGSIAGLAIGGILADRGKLVPGLLGLFAVMAVTLVANSVMLGQAAGSTPGILLALSILVGAASLFALLPLALSRLSVAAGAMAPLALSLNASMSSLGQGAGALWGGFVTDMLGFHWVGDAGAAIALAGIAVSFSLRRIA